MQKTYIVTIKTGHVNRREEYPARLVTEERRVGKECIIVTMYVYFAPWLIPEMSGVSRLSFVRTTISVVSRLAYGLGQDL